MAGKFQWQYFSEINLSDPFFDSLKSDYKEFSNCFNENVVKKSVH